MKLTKVTMTGPDDTTTLADLERVSEKYPFVEWGILLSRSSTGGRRFPSRKWLEKLYAVAYNSITQFKEMKFSGHLCGAYVRQLLLGNTDFVSEIGSMWDMFSRIQINTHGVKHPYHGILLTTALSQYPDKEFIFQYDNENREILNAMRNYSRAKISTLFDLSHGAGVLPEQWPHLIPGISCGYAGGLGPDNISEQLQLIAGKVGDGETWVDMETKIRSEDDRIFDLDKVETVLEICKPFI